MNNKINVAIVGVGNCAAALIEGAYYYTLEMLGEQEVPGLMHKYIGGYGPFDLQFVAAFDVAQSKVGKDLSQAIYQPPNNLSTISEVPFLDVTVLPGIVSDGVGSTLAERVDVVEKENGIDEVVQILKATNTHVLINYLPVGSEIATRAYAQAALHAGCAFVNCIPVFIATDAEWQQLYRDAGLPLIGDDIKSQFGATIVHRELVRLFLDRGMVLDRTYQLNFGGNMDFYNMLSSGRLASKRKSKTGSVLATMENNGADFPSENIHVSPSDYVEWLGDRKWAYIRLEGRQFGGLPISAELKLEVNDSPNSAGVVMDAVRLAKVALDRGIGGPIDDVCAYLMKSPSRPAMSDTAARLDLERFILGG